MSRLAKEHFVTTLDYLHFSEYVERSHILTNSDQTIIGQLKFVRKILEAAANTRVLLLQSSSGQIHPDLLAAIIMGIWWKSQRPLVVMMGCMWQKDPGLPGLIQKVLLKLADRAIFRYAPQSTDELPLFSVAWGVPQHKLRYLPYFYTFTERDLNLPAPEPEPFIFAGGNSHRDYEVLLQVAEALPEHKFVIASRLLDGRRLPSNVQAGQVSRTEFIRLMRTSSAVLVPIQKNLIRATAQQTYLNAMLLEKPTIITDSLGVRDYVLDNETGIIVDGSVESYVKAICRVFDPQERVRINYMCKTARESVLQNFSFEKHCERLLAILDEAIDDYYAAA